MKTLQEFNKLPKNEQVYRLFHEGQELLSRCYKNYIIKLFHINDLFVEIWYHSHKNLIEKIEVVNDKKLLKIYESEINLEELLNQ